jgi:hypothetical protein
VVARLDLVPHPARGTRFLFEWFEVFYNRQRHQTVHHGSHDR